MRPRVDRASNEVVAALSPRLRASCRDSVALLCLSGAAFAQSSDSDVDDDSVPGRRTAMGNLD